jgi:hypothetical protein
VVDWLSSKSNTGVGGKWVFRSELGHHRRGMGLFISEKTNSVTPAPIPGMGCCRVNAVVALQIEGDVSTDIPETLSFPTLDISHQRSHLIRLRRSCFYASAKSKLHWRT